MSLKKRKEEEEAKAWLALILIVLVIWGGVALFKHLTRFVIQEIKAPAPIERTLE